MEIKYYLESDSYAPERAHKEDAGWDIRTPKFVIVPAHGSVFVDSGVHVLIPQGYVGMLKSKSGLNVKKSINTEGVIDAGYTSSIGIKIYNHSNSDVAFDRGDKITQLVIMPIPSVEMVEVQNFNNIQTSRGDNGFGSTGR